MDNLLELHIRREWRRDWVTWLVFYIHLTWGFLLIFVDGSLLKMSIFSSLPINNSFILGLCFLGACVAVLISKYYDLSLYKKLLLYLPQQFMLMMMSFSALMECYANIGTPAFFESIIDHIWRIIGMVVHTCSLVDWFWYSRKA